MFFLKIKIIFKLTSPIIVFQHQAYWEGSVKDKNWQLLKELLESYDSLENGFSFYKCVVETLLENGFALPCWLREFYLKQCPQELLLILIQKESWNEAMEFTRHFLKKRSFDDLKRKSDWSQWTPFNLLDILYKNVSPRQQVYLKEVLLS